MKSYNETPLTDGDDITAITYYKCPYPILTNMKLMNVYVQNIDNIGSGTVNARIGETDSYTEINKTQLYQYINFLGYSLTA